MNNFNEWFELFPMIFPFIVWFGTFFFIGKVSGWKNISQIYTQRDVSLHGKQTFKHQSAKIGGAKYNNAITIHTTTEGIQF